MESVAEHINEMQKINDEFGPVFEDLTQRYYSNRSAKNAPPPPQIEIGISDLQMYGLIEWLNALEFDVRPSKRSQNGEFYSLVFVFRSCLVLLSCEKTLSGSATSVNSVGKKKKKSTERGGQNGQSGIVQAPSLDQLFSVNQQSTDQKDSVRFQTVIPVNELEVRPVSAPVNAINNKFQWQILHRRVLDLAADRIIERVYHLANSTEIARNDFLRIIRHCIRDSVRNLHTQPQCRQSQTHSQSQINLNHLFLSPPTLSDQKDSYSSGSERKFVQNSSNQSHIMNSKQSDGNPQNGSTSVALNGEIFAQSNSLADLFGTQIPIFDVDSLDNKMVRSIAIMNLRDEALRSPHSAKSLFTNINTEILPVNQGNLQIKNAGQQQVRNSVDSRNGNGNGNGNAKTRANERGDGSPVWKPRSRVTYDLSTCDPRSRPSASSDCGTAGLTTAAASAYGADYDLYKMNAFQLQVPVPLHATDLDSASCDSDWRSVSTGGDSRLSLNSQLSQHDRAGGRQTRRLETIESEENVAAAGGSLWEALEDPLLEQEFCVANRICPLDPAPRHSDLRPTDSDRCVAKQFHPLGSNREPSLSLHSFHIQTT